MFIQIKVAMSIPEALALREIKDRIYSEIFRRPSQSQENFLKYRDGVAVSGSQRLNSFGEVELFVKANIHRDNSMWLIEKYGRIVDAVLVFVTSLRGFMENDSPEISESDRLAMVQSVKQD